jgi:hypothetical protein
VEKTVIAHSTCWRTQPADSTAVLAVGCADAGDQRAHPGSACGVYKLLDQGVGLLECARRLGWALNTVKRYARAATAQELQRPPR